MGIDSKKIFVGWDSREQVSYDVCEYSIQRHSNVNYPILPLKQSELRQNGLYYREIDLLASTEFSLTRFLTPYLSEYKGYSIFMDCDFLITDDIDNLFNSIDKTKAISVVKHDYTPSEKIKMDGKQQHIYPKKNWSSLIVFNNEHPSNKKLDLEMVNNQTPQFLHRFSWLSDEEIGEISYEWNYLVGWYNDIEKPKGIHYTEGGPWFPEYKDCESLSNITAKLNGVCIF
jgi:lipopolysaccharide biosynthesis glycosyltransferase